MEDLLLLLFLFAFHKGTNAPQGLNYLCSQYPSSYWPGVIKVKMSAAANF